MDENKDLTNESEIEESAIENSSKEAEDPHPSKSQPTKPINVKGKVIWTLFFFLIAYVSIRVVASQSKDFSFPEFLDFLGNMNPVQVLFAFLCMFGFIFFEGLAILMLCRAFGFRCGKRDGFFYSASDIYFSAITPSATGGQPASAYFMIKDGMPPMAVTVVLLSNLTMYTVSIVLIGIITFIIRPGIFLSFSTGGKVLILVGSFMQLSLVFFFFMLLLNEKIIHAIGKFVIHVFAKMKLIRHEQKRLDKLTASMRDFRIMSKAFARHKKLMLSVLLMNVLQRASQITVTVFVYLAHGGEMSKIIDVWCMQSYTVLGSNCMPVPGAIGISDFLLFDAFSTILSDEVTAHLELATRATSFYSCIILCGITIIIKLIFQRRKNKKL